MWWIKSSKVCKGCVVVNSFPTLQQQNDPGKFISAEKVLLHLRQPAKEELSAMSRLCIFLDMNKVCPLLVALSHPYAIPG